MMQRLYTDISETKVDKGKPITLTELMSSKYYQYISITLTTSNDSKNAKEHLILVK